MKSRVYWQHSNDREPDKVRAGLLEWIENELEAGYRMDESIHKAIMGAPTTALEYSNSSSTCWEVYCKVNLNEGGNTNLSARPFNQRLVWLKGRALFWF